MKQLLRWVLVMGAIMAVAGPASAQYTNILANGNLESWATNGPNGPPDHWNLGTGRISAIREASLIRSGSYSAKVVYDSTGTLRVDYESVPVIGDSVYTCSLYVYDVNNSTVRMRPWFFFSPSGSGGPGSYSSDSAGYKLYTYSMAAPTTAVSLVLQMRFYGGTLNQRDSIWLDDVSLWGYFPSGNIPPSISQVNRFPFPTVLPTDDVNVRATITDSDGSIATDSLYIQINSGGFSPVASDSVVGSFHWYNIGAYPEFTVVDYYVAATDNEGSRSQSATSSYTVSEPGIDTLAIAEIEFNNTNQGTSPDCYPNAYFNQQVTFGGKVVGRYERPGRHDWFFVQDSYALWSGAYVYDANVDVQIGDDVSVTATASEYFGMTEMMPVTSVVINSTGNTTNPTIITCANLGSSSCNVNHEPYEGMLLQINNATVTSSATSQEFWINDGSGDSCLVWDDLYYNPPDSLPVRLQIGQLYSYIRGIGFYGFSQYKISPRIPSDIQTPVTECTGSSIFDIQFTGDPGIDTVDCWPPADTGQLVSVCGIVTAVAQGSQPRFFLQDQNNTTWGGMYCFDYRYDNGDTIVVSLGDYIQVTAHLHDYYGWTELDSVTELFELGTNQPLPETAVVNIATLANLCDFTAESYENILVRINDVTVGSADGSTRFWIKDNSTTDSIRLNSDNYRFGTDLPNPLPSYGATYSWLVGAIKWEGRQGGGNTRGWMIMPRFASDFEASVIPEPAVFEVWPVNATTLAVKFDRTMNPSSANPGYYSTTGGLTISGASMSPDNRIVYLTTSTQPNNVVDNLITVGPCDSLGYCMTVPDNDAFHSGFTSISIVQTPGPDTASQILNDVVTLKGVLVSDSTMSHPTNIFINDGSGPPYNGCLVYTGGFVGTQPVKGDTLIMTSKVLEYFRATELADLGVYNNVQILSPGNDPIPYQMTADDLDYLDLARGEELEGVLVTLCDSVEITNAAFDAYGFMVRSLSSPTDSFIVHNQPPQHTRYSYTPVVGARIIGITGVFRFQRDQFRLMPRYDADFNSMATWCGGGGECVFVPGDGNGNGSTNGLDVTFMVNYLKGGLLEPPIQCNCPGPLFPGADANGNCSFNGLDVTYLVNYLKGGTSAPLGCPGCP